MKIVYSSRSTVDIEYEGKTARFYGELGAIGFLASTNSMRWMAPERDAPVSQEERDKLISAVIEYRAHMKTPILFMEDKGNEL